MFFGEKAVSGYFEKFDCIVFIFNYIAVEMFEFLWFRFNEFHNFISDFVDIAHPSLLLPNVLEFDILYLSDNTIIDLHKLTKN